MKKEVLCLFLGLILLNYVGFVSAWAGESGTAIYKGWNLIYGFASPDQIQGLDKTHIKAIYAFIPTTQQYARMYPNREDSKIKIDDDILLDTAFWVYSDMTVEGEFNGLAHGTEYWLSKIPLNLDRRPVYKGWNFIGITPDFIGKTIDELKGNCYIERVYLWDAENQKWSSSLNGAEIGAGAIVKIANSNVCKLGANSSSLTNPPTLPSEESNIPSTPKNIGDYYLKDSSNEGPNADPKCAKLEDHPDTKWTNLTGEVCSKGWRVNYLNNQTNKGVFVIFTQITKGKDLYEKYFGLVAKPYSISGLNLMRLEQHELFWFTSGNYNLIATQEYTLIPSLDGNGASYSYGVATGDNDVTKWLLQNYLPI